MWYKSEIYHYYRLFKSKKNQKKINFCEGQLANHLILLKRNVKSASPGNPVLTSSYDYFAFHYISNPYHSTPSLFSLSFSFSSFHLLLNIFSFSPFCLFLHPYHPPFSYLFSFLTYFFIFLIFIILPYSFLLLFSFHPPPSLALLSHFFLAFFLFSSSL